MVTDEKSMKLALSTKFVYAMLTTVLDVGSWTY